VYDARPTTDLIALLRLCAAGDRAALRTLYDQEATYLYGLALRITRDPSLAADALHDAFIQIARRADRFDPTRGSAQAWLVSLVRYRALDVVRRRSRETLTDTIPEQADENPGPLEGMVGSSEVEALRRCLEELEAARRQLVMSAFMDGLSHQQLAERFELPLGTVKSSIRRGLLALKGCLER
jgi:RNA polymerase sigma-70 factor (ECF subfamily)